MLTFKDNIIYIIKLLSGNFYGYNKILVIYNVLCFIDRKQTNIKGLLL